MKCKIRPFCTGSKAYFKNTFWIRPTHQSNHRQRVFHAINWPQMLSQVSPLWLLHQSFIQKSLSFIHRRISGFFETGEDQASVSNWNNLKLEMIGFKSLADLSIIWNFLGIFKGRNHYRRRAQWSFTWFQELKRHREPTHATQQEQWPSVPNPHSLSKDPLHIIYVLSWYNWHVLSWETILFHLKPMKIEELDDRLKQWNINLLVANCSSKWTLAGSLCHCYFSRNIISTETNVFFF